MENNRLLNDEEIKCLKNMHNYAALAKCTLIAMWTGCLLFFVVPITDAVRFLKNVERTPVGYFIPFVVIIAILLVVFAVFFTMLRSNLSNNKIWHNILDKFGDENNLNTELDKNNSDMKASVSVYLSGNLITLSDKLKEVGDALEAVGSIGVIFSMMKYCSTVLSFTKAISKAYNIKLGFNVKLCLVLCILPSLIVTVYESAETAGVVSLKKDQRQAIISRLNENCEQTSYYELSNDYTLYKDKIILQFYDENDENNFIWSHIEFDENDDITKMAVSIHYNSSMSKQEIIDNVNMKLSQLNDLLTMSEMSYKYDFLGEKYELSEAFVNKFIDMNDTNLGIENRIEDEYGLEKPYTVKTYAYVDEIDNKPTGKIYIRLEIDDNPFFWY